ncbi:MAG: type II toxin-antitoxin system RatA family toxin [bacterium]|jgi:ribosome-associated toxin RatA of RatAB toxin-antitoxin module
MNLKEEIEIDANADIVFKVMLDLEKFPEFMEDVKKITILEENENRRISEWESEIDGLVFKWQEEDLYYPQEYKLTYRLIKGDLDKFEGYWQVIKLSENKSKLVLFLTFDLNIPTLKSLIMPTIKFKVKKNLALMLKAIKSRAESLAFA